MASSEPRSTVSVVAREGRQDQDNDEDDYVIVLPGKVNENHLYPCNTSADLKTGFEQSLLGRYNAHAQDYTSVNGAAAKAAGLPLQNTVLPQALWTQD